MKVGDVVLVHDDTTRIHWKLAVIESVNKGADGMIRSANIRTATGRTNRPIARLYPLEVSATEVATQPSAAMAQETRDMPVLSKRPMREAAKRGQEQVKQWIASLSAPPRRMSWTASNSIVTVILAVCIIDCGFVYITHVC